jgi:hypothetical protein
MPSRSLESAYVISEKILQRYVFEKLSESASTRRNLLPHRLDSKAECASSLSLQQEQLRQR